MVILGTNISGMRDPSANISKSACGPSSFRIGELFTRAGTLGLLVPRF